MSNSNLKQTHSEPETIIESKISTSDITDLLNKYRSLQAQYGETNAKPALLFVGDSGVGKSSCIASILNLNQEYHAEILKNMNISTHGKEGTTEACVVEGQHLRCIDIRGKQRSESDSDYKSFLENVIEQSKKDIHLIVGVVKAHEERDDDIQNLLISLRSICLHYDKPFLILMNQSDRITSFQRYREREQKLTDISAGIRAKHSWYTIRGPSLNKGVFTVSARPTAQLPPGCPRTALSADPLDEPHVSTIVCSGIRYCRQCNQADIAKELMDPKDPNNFSKMIQRLEGEKKAIINYIRAGDPIGLTIDDPAIKTAVSLVDDLAGAAVIKSVVSTLEQRIKGVATYIDEIADGVYRKVTAKELDEKLCAKLVNLFDLPTTSMTQARYEHSRWVKAEEEWRIKGIWRFITRDHALTYYLAAWGIYYALKFRDIAVTIAHGFAKGTSSDILIVECQKTLANHPDTRQEEYLKYITEHKSTQKAYEKFLVPI